MFEEFLQYGILLAVLIFGVKIGLAMGFAGIKRKTAGLILLGYGIGLVILCVICQPYTNLIYEIVYGYSSAIFAVIAAIILITGFKTIYDWQKTGQDRGTSTCMAMVAPCPCCFGAILASVMVVSPVIGVSAASLGLLSAISLVLVMGATYLVSTKLVTRINRPYPIVLGNFMIFMGLYFVLCIIILPNMVYITQGSTISISDTTGMIGIIIAAILLLIVGAVYARKRSSLIQY